MTANLRRSLPTETQTLYRAAHGSCGGRRVVKQITIVINLYRFAILGGMFLMSSILAPAWGAYDEEPLAAEVRWTRYGIPHVKAHNYGGYGYAYARHHLCLLADRTLTLRGERSRHFGAQGHTTVGFIETSNLNSDLFYRVQLSKEAVAQASSELSPDARALARDYAAGVNRYSREKSGGPCGLVQVPFLEESDVILTMLAIGAIWKGHLVAAAATASTRAAIGTATDIPITADSLGLGSNAWAYGADVTGTGRAIVVGNPHSAWDNHRLLMRQLHLTIPGELNVAGADVVGLPLPVVGYTRDIAWTIEAPHGVHYFVLHDMSVDFNDNPSYVMDGVRRPIAFDTVHITVLEDGEKSEQRFEIPMTELGPLYALPAQRGRAVQWYAITDASAGNALGIDQLLQIARSSSVDGITEAVTAHRGFGAHLIAGDRHGDVLYIEGGPLLDITEKTPKRCALPAVPDLHVAAASIIVFDGTRSDCAVRTENGEPWLAPASTFSDLKTRGVIQNTNNSYHFSEFGTRHAGHSPLLSEISSGPNDTRLMMSKKHIGELLFDGRVTIAEAKGVVFSNRNYAAETALDDIRDVCGETPHMRPAGKACTILGVWNRRTDTDSRGALLFDHLWPALARVPRLYSILLDPTKTAVGDPDDTGAIIALIEQTVESLASMGFTGAEPWGSVLRAPAPEGGVVPLHGGAPTQGILNVLIGGSLRAKRFGNIRAGTSYVQVVTWTDRTPYALTLLAHSQSSDPTSAHFADQLHMFANKDLVELPFEEESILSDSELESTTIRQLKRIEP